MDQQAALTMIETQATSALGTYNPVAKVHCPHCSGIMAARDARAHVFTAAWRSSYGLPATLDDINAAALADAARRGR